MATYIFEQIANQGKAEGYKPGDPASREWYREAAGDVTSVNVRKELRNTNKLQTKLTEMDIGRMYMFFYSPKHADTLPYYDRFPLTFVIERYRDGFLGMNLHYLSPMYRARMMDALYTVERNDALRESQKLRLSYNLLTSSAKYKYYRPTVKRYLTQHVKSRYLYVPSEDWDTALMLPTERFRKAKKQQVWRDSKASIRKRR